MQMPKVQKLSKVEDEEPYEKKRVSFFVPGKKNFHDVFDRNKIFGFSATMLGAIEAGKKA